ncbi:hypothetical protein HY087_00305 [Candidatus Gottesmanbacteria bacterium]|nr:hypothetical protein [Candidatus Gottesmanbacteria bacterium]
MLEDIFHRGQSGDRNQGEVKTKKPTVEEAITAWENNHERNSEGNKIVRGVDGKPVEVVTVKSGKDSVWAFLVNGETREQFQIGGELQSMDVALGTLRFEQFINGNIFNAWYELKGIQRLDAQVSDANQGFVFGQPGTQPESLQVSFV